MTDKNSKMKENSPWDHNFKDAHAYICRHGFCICTCLIHTHIQKIKNLEGDAQMFTANIWVVGLQ